MIYSEVSDRAIAKVLQFPRRVRETAFATVFGATTTSKKFLLLALANVLFLVRIKGIIAVPTLSDLWNILASNF
ncbi:hypothetical protein A6V25_16095 [Nostoc sp. ATCC 53789]|nr:hypothetical protein A6V25_16095 [Nostoc sp. ATCC 53789]